MMPRPAHVHTHGGARASRLDRVWCGRGQAMIEYLVICAALGFALFYPIKDASSPDKARTAVEIVIQQFQLGFQNFSHSISLP